MLSEQLSRIPPNNIAEGVLQGLSEFGISLLGTWTRAAGECWNGTTLLHFRLFPGGISGIAHHPLQYAASESGDRSLINSISLGIMGVLTRPLSGAAELVARTGQGILSHIGWNAIPVSCAFSCVSQLLRVRNRLFGRQFRFEAMLKRRTVFQYCK